MGNIYEKIQEAKDQLQKLEIKKTGQNKFSGFSYYELADIMPPIISIFKKLKLYSSVSFTDELATLTIIDAEQPTSGDEFSAPKAVAHTSPMRNLELKGCNAIQALGGVETYQRRYLYMMALDIVEADAFDAIAGSDKNDPPKAKTPKAETKPPPKESPNMQDPDSTITEEQQKRLYTIVREQDREHEDALKVIVATLQHYGYEKSKDVLVKDYGKIVMALEDGKGLPF